MEPLIPLDVQRFILDRIDSIGHLECLLLLRGSPDDWWDEGRIAERLYISVKDCRPITIGLYTAGLLVRDKTEKGYRYRYCPSRGDFREMVDRLAYYYSRHVVPISNLVHLKPRSRIEEFSRAFDMEKKGDE
jgi:hypothetical protein